MVRLLFVLLAGLVGAAVLHIVIVLALPAYADRDVWTRVIGLGEADVFHVLPVTKSAGLTSVNPLLRTAVCRFDLTEESVRVTASGITAYWSLSIFDPEANETYSMNDRISADGVLDIVIVTPLQMIGYRKSLPDDLSESILVEIPDTAGYVVLRTLTPDASWDVLAGTFLDEATCQPVSSL